MNKTEWASTVLPLAVRRELLRAASIDPNMPAGESIRRQIELRAVTDRAKVQYPEFFRQYSFFKRER